MNPDRPARSPLVIAVLHSATLGTLGHPLHSGLPWHSFRDGTDVVMDGTDMVRHSHITRVFVICHDSP
jgi:hypothetical protein